MRRGSGRTGRVLGARGARCGFLGATLVAYALASGCGSIAVSDDTTPVPPSYNPAAPAATPGPRHDLAILAAGFDPPLDSRRILNHDPVSVVVGVSNQGTESEHQVLLTADLWSGDGSEQLLHTQQTLGAIAAGDILPVRLRSAYTPPFLDQYRLIVKVGSAAPDANLANNVRTLTITVDPNP